MNNINWRHEKKYLINVGEYHTLKNRIKYIMNIDSNSNEFSEYHIRSLYFEDIFNTSLFEKLSGLEERYKFRIRIYNYSDKIIKLEKKMKKLDLTLKKAKTITRDEADNIINGNFTDLNLDNPLIKEIFIKSRTNLLKPLVIVDYSREAYTLPISNMRITFDKNLSTGMYSTDMFNKNISTIPALDNPLIILEIKYDNFMPQNVQNLLQLPFRQQLSISKYAICRKYTKLNDWEDQ